MTDKNFTLALTIIMLMVFFLGGLNVRPLIPPDETRYLTVAWEMLVRGDFILPTMNFEPYHHKPPLLFWLINGSWALGGVADWPPRLMMSLVCALFLYLTYRLYQRVLPQSANIALLLILASPPFIVYATHIMFDTLMGVFVLMAIISLWDLAEKPQNKLSWLYLTLAIAGGGLAKGPAVLLHILPLALLMPLWVEKSMRPNLSRWYGYVFLSTIIGIALVLLWAIPAALRGGPEYAKMIFYGQSAGRMVQAFDHARPIYWYLPIIIGFCLFPLLSKPFWQGLNRIRTEGFWQPNERNALHFFLCWAVPVLFAFSLISGKQVHYLMPVVPAMLGVVTIIIARTPDAFAKIRWLSFASFIVLLGILLFGETKLDRYDLNPLGAAYAAYGTKGPVAVDEKYDGEYGYIMRLTKPISVVKHADMAAWIKANPNGLVIHRKGEDENNGFEETLTPIYSHAFRTHQKISLLVP